MGWRTAYALDTLRGEVNAMAPRRDKGSDGTIGDAAHASRSSDHNPWVVVNGQGVVRAWDVDKDGLNLPQLFEKLRRMGEAGDVRLAGGGYLILNRRITKPDFSGWKEYKGSNPHEHHGHISFSRSEIGFDSRAPWGIAAASGSTFQQTSNAVLQVGSTGPEVQRWQNHLNVMYRRFRPELVADGKFGPATESRTRQVQQFLGIGADGRVGPETRRATRF